MALNQPNFIPQPWGANGTYATIPAATAEKGRASWAQGFPEETALPRSAGGVPPHRLDFQGVLHALSEHAVFQQSGGTYAWSPDFDYPAGARVAGSDGIVRRALHASGPGTAAGAKNPASDANPAFWTVETFPDGESIVADAEGKLSAADLNDAFATAEGSATQRTMESRFADVVNPRDFGASGDNLENDTQAFSRLESSFQGRVVDLLGRKYVVDELPVKNEYINGWFNIPVKTDGVTVGRILSPTKDIYKQRLTQVSPSDGNYNAWPQDTAHTYKGALFTFYNPDITHTSVFEHPCLAISVNGGDSFDYAQHINTGSSYMSMVYSAGVSPAGTQFAIVSAPRGEYSEENTLKLIGRRMPEFFNLSVENDIEIELTATNGVQGFTLKFKDAQSASYVPHGLLVGDSVSFSGTEVSVGGIAVSGRFLVTASDDLASCAIEKDSGGSAATSTATSIISTGYCSLNNLGKFHELLFTVNGQQKSFGVALKDFTGASGNPTLAHALCFANNAAYTWIHGGAYTGTLAGSHLVKISQVQTPSRSIAYVRNFDGYAGVEGTIAYLGDNKFIGALRTEASSYAMRYYIYNETTDTFVIKNNRFGKNHFEKSPVPVRIVGDYVVFTMSENRYTEPGDSSSAMKNRLIIPIVIAYAKKSDILAHLNDFESTLTYEIVGNAYYTISRNAASGAGVPSLTAIGNNVYIFYSSHSAYVIGNRDGYPNVYCLRLDMSRTFTGDISRPAMEISGNRVLNNGGYDKNFSAVDWESTPYYITVYLESVPPGVSGGTVTSGLRATFSVDAETHMASSGKVNFYFTNESYESGSRFDFPIGHTFYDIEAHLYGTAKDLQRTTTTFGIPEINYLGRTPQGFSITLKTPSPDGGTQDGVGTMQVKVALHRPIDWLEH